MADSSQILRYFNQRFSAEQLDAYMAKYPCGVGELPERLSEMFHFDRRGYVVGSQLQQDIMPLLDVLDGGATKEGRVDTVVNNSGVLGGYFVAGDNERRWELWTPSSMSSDSF